MRYFASCILFIALLVPSDATYALLKPGVIYVARTLLSLSITVNDNSQYLQSSDYYQGPSSASYSDSYSSLSSSSDQSWSFGSSRGYIYGAKQALNLLNRRVIDSKVTSSPINEAADPVLQSDKAPLSFTDIYNEIGNIERTYQLKQKLAQFVLETNSQDCARLSSEKAIYDLNTINEYFLISNDGRKKVMIADSFRGQKLQFILQGLASLQSDLQATLFCASY